MNQPTFPTIPDAIVTQTFNNPNPGIYGGDGKHKGIDFGIAVGTPVYACMDGKIVIATIQPTGYGRHVRIQHLDGSLSIYGHLSKIISKEFDQVSSGQIIGYSGGDPNDNNDGDGTSTGPHLHWEIRPPGKTASDQTAVDPEIYCKQYFPKAIKTGEATEVLNVRSAPKTGQVLYTLRRKQVVEIIEIRNGWARLYSLRPEWCSVDYLSIYENPTSEMSDLEKIRRLWDAHPELH